MQEEDDGYQLMIPMTTDSSLGLSSHNIFTIRSKSLFLLKAYQIALEKMRVGVRWIDDCCKQAVIFINSLGINDLLPQMLIVVLSYFNFGIVLPDTKLSKVSTYQV